MLLGLTILGLIPIMLGIIWYCRQPPDHKNPKDMTLEAFSKKWKVQITYSPLYQMYVASCKSFSDELHAAGQTQLEATKKLKQKVESRYRRLRLPLSP